MDYDQGRNVPLHLLARIQLTPRERWMEKEREGGVRAKRKREGGVRAEIKRGKKEGDGREDKRRM